MRNEQNIEAFIKEVVATVMMHVEHHMIDAVRLAYENGYKAKAHHIRVAALALKSLEEKQDGKDHNHD